MVILSMRRISNTFQAFYATNFPITNFNPSFVVAVVLAVVVHDLLCTFIQNTQEIKRTLFNWMKQDKTCKFSRKSSFSSYVQQKNRKTNK